MPPSPDQVAAERKARRQVRLLVDLTTACLCQDRELEAREAVRMVDALRDAILGLFPDGSGAFDLLVRPRLQRILFERWGVRLDPDDEVVH